MEHPKCPYGAWPNGRCRIGDHLTLRGVADDLPAYIALKATTDGVVVPSGSRNDFDFAISLQIRDDRIGRPKIDADLAVSCPWYTL